MVAPLALAAVGALGAYAVSRAVDPTSQPETRHPDTAPVVGRPLTQAETLRRFAASRGEYTPIVGAPPAGARKVPIVALQWTPLVAYDKRAGNLARHPAQFREALAVWAALLSEVGRTEDPRCSLWLCMKETAWCNAAWGRNLGNRKCREFASLQTILAPNDPHVYTTNEHSNGIHLLIDRVRSFDSYRTFPSFAASLRDETRLFSIPRYRGVLEGYRRGGLDGLKDAITAMHRGGYSPGVLAAKLTECDQYWRIGARLAGSAWNR